MYIYIDILSVVYHHQYIYIYRLLLYIMYIMYISIIFNGGCCFYKFFSPRPTLPLSKENHVLLGEAGTEMVHLEPWARHVLVRCGRWLKKHKKKSGEIYYVLMCFNVFYINMCFNLIRNHKSI